MRIQSLILWLFILAFAGYASAQAPTATVVGRVTDASHAAVAGAAVHIRSLDTNQVRTAETQADGQYTVTALVPGPYQIEITKEGFQAASEPKIVLEADQSARLDVELRVGAVSEKIEVRSSVTVLNTENATLGDVVTPTQIAEIPLFGRDFNDLAFLIPGAQPSEQNGKGAPFIANGQRADSSGILIDGLNDESPRDAGAQARPPLDSLQEFRFETSGYSAQYGRLAGGQVTMVLKSGTNELHGSLFEYLANDALDARNAFDTSVKSELRRNQFGGSFGGPLTIPKIYSGRDRTFFFVSWESYRQISGTNSIGVVPTLEERKGDFSHDFNAMGSLILIKDPMASGSCNATSRAACFDGNMIQPYRFNQVGVNVAAFYPLPNRPGPNNFQVNVGAPDSWDNFLFKVDQRVGDKDNFSVRVLERWEQSMNPFSGGAVGFGATTNTTQELYGISETRVFTPRLINEFRAGLTRTLDAELSAHAGVNYAQQLGISGTTTDPSLEGFPKFSVTGYETLGDSTSNPIRYTVNNFDFNDSITWIKGRHAIKFGADLVRVQYYQPTNSNFNGTFTSNGKATGDGFADLLLGYESSTSIKTGTVTNHLFQSLFAGFVQDDYKILPSLTLNLGFRYEIQFAPYEENGQVTSYVPGLGQAIIGSAQSLPNLSSILATSGLTQYVGIAGVGNSVPFSLVNTNYLDLAPRVGMAWRPFGNNKTVIRSGYGIFYTGQRLSAMRTDIASGFPFSISDTFTAPSNNLGALTLSNPFPSSLLKFSGVTTTSGYELKPPSPYVQSWNLTVERQLGKGVVLVATYNGSKGTHLGRKYDINQEIRLANNQLANGNYPRPFPGFTDIEYYSFGFNSSYEAGTLTLKRRFAGGLTFAANYTYSKSIDENSGFNYAGAGDFNGAQNSQNTFGEKGLSDFDMRHTFNANATWQIPWNHDIFTRGWQLSGTGVAYSGQPFTPYVSGANVDLAQASRPNRVGNGSLPNPTSADWFNLNAFQIVPDSAFAFGNSGRNILEGPGTFAMNAALSRRFSIRERTKLIFRFEAFNLTNHTNLQLPGAALDKSNAGTIIATKPQGDFGGQRTLQGSIRLTF
jgi:outer membrane receptor protein involved in Fe transport